MVVTLETVAHTFQGLYRMPETGAAYRRDVLLASLPRDVLTQQVHLLKRGDGIYFLCLDDRDQDPIELLSRRRHKRPER